MRTVQRPPTMTSECLAKIIDLLHDPQLAAYVANANAVYHHWDTLRRRPPPLGLTAEQGWAAVRLSRTRRRPIPLQDVGGRAFNYWLPDATQHVLHLIDRQGGGALAAEAGTTVAFAEMKDRVLMDSLMEEAIATSQIEGAVTTRKVAKELLRSGRKPRDRSEQMIFNGYRTVRLLRERTDQPLTLDLLHEVQRSITQDTLDDPADAGRFRAEGDAILVVDERDGEVVFTPPPAGRLPDRLAALIEFANTETSGEHFIHPLVKATILHFWLAYEHPYVDGNGRTARALFYWSMLKSGYWLFEFLTISRVIHAGSMGYYRSFVYSETDDNDLTYSIVYMLDVTRKALEDLHGRIGEMREQQHRMDAIRVAKGLNLRQRAVLDHAIRHPGQIYTFESHAGSHGITYQTARTDLIGLADRGLLRETGSRKPREFYPAPDLDRRLSGRRK